ncbi:arginine--tRNA ligase [Paenibacillus glufosinatiresistens]|uniref:arginine--tRNA ligase n=1 Tax=Paenibacillus glufosinatiresistens TaxID=3070657 RepID=UPI00286E473F|nr:arginine--tRNA ligase [Paenibacillus sp. YX.27]
MQRQEIEAVIQTGTEQALRRLNRLDGLDIAVRMEQPANPLHGDYSSNIAMQLAGKLRRPPMELAALIKAECEGLWGTKQILPLIDRIEIASPGFLNVYIDWKAWARRAPSSVFSGRAGKTIVEHTSVNPNKSMHIGHLRNSCIGDTLARLLRRTGSEVEVHYYVDDLGNQLADTVVGLMEIPLDSPQSRFGDFCWNLYAAINQTYEQHPELLNRRSEILHDLEAGDNNTAWFGALVAEKIIREHLAEMKRFGIRYDVLVWESAIVREGLWDAAFKQLKKTSKFVLEREGPQAGCWVLRVGDESASAACSPHLTDKVLVRSNGILTYTAKDIAYHLWKFGLLDHELRYSEFVGGVSSTDPSGEPGLFGKADAVVNVIDVRQEYPQQVIRGALQAMGYGSQAERLHHASYGVVSLSPATAAELGIDISDGRSSYVMSGRQGIGIKISELLDRMESALPDSRGSGEGLSSRTIAAAAIRYYLLRFSLDTEIVFDMKQATEMAGNTGVYLMYAHARASNVLSKGQPISSPNPMEPPESMPEEPEQAERLLIRSIAGWPDALERASAALAPQMLCSYAYQLATHFNQFYTACPILRAESATARYRLWLTARFAATLKDALEVIGLPAPERL